MRPTAYMFIRNDLLEFSQLDPERFEGVNPKENPIFPLYEIPRGYKLVPIEPTDKMIRNCAGWAHLNCDTYKAIIEAAPSLEDI